MVHHKGLLAAVDLWTVCTAVFDITSHHMVKADAGLNGLYIREINIYIRLYY